MALKRMDNVGIIVGLAEQIDEDLHDHAAAVEQVMQPPAHGRFRPASGLASAAADARGSRSSAATGSPSSS
jgi:hypothetical protein